MKTLQNKVLNPFYGKKEDLVKRFHFYNSNKFKTREFLNKAKEVSQDELLEQAKALTVKPNLKNILKFLKIVTNTSSWISTSYIRHLRGLIDFSQKDLSQKEKELQNPRIQKILNLVINNSKGLSNISDQEFFKAIFNELEFAYHNPLYQSPIKFPQVNVTMMLVSGVFNELFSTPAFDRGAKHLFETHGVKYVNLVTKGTKGAEHNSQLLKRQIREYVRKHPEEKIWLIGFSKGGLDVLHYLANDSDFANKHIRGFSAIASPIMGSEHLSHWTFKTLNSIHKLSGTKLYQYFDSKADILAKQLQKSLSTKYLRHWFEENHHRLPHDIFYTAVAFESGWLESHLWMKLAKMLFNSETVNDGVVDAKNAFFPDYFKSKRLGIIKGHHLVGNRSSYYSQEALLEAHLIYLHHLDLL